MRRVQQRNLHIDASSELITIFDAAKILRVGVEIVEALIAAGQIEATRVAGLHLVSRTEVEGLALIPDARARLCHRAR